ncbi:hypothetical protein [Mucilaginibacter sp.]|uniref:hypothetical protein n=1 Tax=Mucilaginibacter sp. TaxID=1882438 RepID=UPI0035BC1856
MTSLEKFKWKLIAFVCCAVIAGGILWYLELYLAAVIVEAVFALIMLCGYLIEEAVGKEDRNEW